MPVVCSCCVSLTQETLQHPPFSGINQLHQLGPIFQLLACNALITGMVHGMLGLVLQEGHLEIL